MVGMMRLKKRPQRGVISLLDRFQGGPAREESTDQWRVEGCEPTEDLRAIAFEHACQPVRQAGFVVDQCPAVLDETLARPGGLVGRTPWLQFLLMLPDQFESERGIRGIILLPTWREGFAKLGQHARMNGVKDQVVILQERIDQAAFRWLQADGNVATRQSRSQLSGPVVNRFRHRPYDAVFFLR